MGPYPKLFENPVVQRMYEEGQARIDQMKIDLAKECPDGVLRLPFRCSGCDRRRTDFALMTGDGLPMCQGCIDGCVAAMSGGVAV